MTKIDYSEMAELYPSKSISRARHHVGYVRFDTAAEALRYAIEQMPQELLRGSLLEIGDERFAAAEIRALYDDETYPLARKPLADGQAQKDAIAEK